MLKILAVNESWQTMTIALFDSLAGSSFSTANTVTKFYPSLSNTRLTFAESDKSVMRPGSVSAYPMARAPIIRGPKFKPTEACTFCVCLERAPNLSNSTSFGVASKNIRSEGSDGVGPTPNSWGIICSFGNVSGATKVMSNGSQVASWRMLEEGDVLRALYFPDGSLVISLNLFECEHRFQLPSEVVAQFGSSPNPEEDQYTFAMTLASDHRVRICS